jgi:hypothetical protein
MEDDMKIRIVALTIFLIYLVSLVNLPNNNLELKEETENLKEETEEISELGSFSYTCAYNYYNCESFRTYSHALTVFNYCKSKGYGDIHSLDGDGNGYPCESLKKGYGSIQKSDSLSYTCSYNYYNCDDLGTYSHALKVFNYCKSKGFGDIHYLDGDDDGYPCEALP